jgi:hypothetical protein
MYRPGKVLYSGGAASIDRATPAQTAASAIDLTAGTPTWRHIAPMHYPRIYHTLTMLADGTVLSVGGGTTSDQSVVTSGSLPAEIWDPATEAWTTVASMAAARNYHSTAILLPDGRVLVAGGGHYNGGGGAGQFSAQYYSPPYLFNGARPSITSAPAAAAYGSDMTVTTPDAASIKSVNLVSLGADTHQSDMNQHFVPLDFTTSSGSLTVKAPDAAALAPPGHYMLFIVNDKGVPSVASIVSISRTLAAPDRPDAPTATAGDGQATVTWNAPDDGGSTITKYTVTPYAGSTAQTPTVVTGNPAATSTTVTGLTNGTAYTFKVSATNAIGSGDDSDASNAVTPAAQVAAPVAFVQQVNKRATAASLALQPTSNVTSANRLVVEAGIWSANGATASTVTDSAGNTYTELTHFKASEKTELSVWTAPITAGAGTRPTVTVKATGSADIGATVLEYSGLATDAGTAVLDQVKTATGTTGSAATTVSSGATAASTADGELALGFYADSGFSNALTGDAAYTVRTNVSPASDIELLAQDRVLTSSATTANPATRTGPRTPWLAATLILKAAPAPPPPAGMQARSLALTQAPVTAPVATTASADTAVDPTQRIYAFTAVTPAPPTHDATSLLFCPVGLTPKTSLRPRPHAFAPRSRSGLLVS